MSIYTPTETQIEDFCLARIQGKNQVEAFRTAFPDIQCGKQAACSRGSSIAKLPQVCARLTELSEIAIEASNKALILDITERKIILTRVAREGLQIVDGQMVDSSAALKAIDTHNKIDGVYSRSQEKPVTVTIIRHIPGRGES